MTSHSTVLKDVSGLQLLVNLKLEPLKYAFGMAEERAGAILPDMHSHSIISD